MDIVVKVGQLLLMLSILVILHEFGHYITAKMFKVRVEKFYLFMDAGFSLFKKKIGETIWGIGWLPLGGYVKLSGMIDESMDTEQMSAEPQPWEFRAKPAWQRLIIMLGGIIVNIILAWLIYTVVYSTYGKKYVATEQIQKNGLSFGTTGEKVGFKDGDKILSADGKSQERFDRLVLDVLLGDNILVERDGKEVNVHLSDEDKKAILDNEGRNFISPRLVGTSVDSLAGNSNAAKAGLKVGDKIVGINNQKTIYFDEVSNALAANKNDSITVNVMRGTTPMDIRAKVTEEGTLGFVYKSADQKNFMITEKYNLLSAIPHAIDESYTQFVYNIKQFKLIVRPATGAASHVKSPIGIAAALPSTWKLGVFLEVYSYVFYRPCLYEPVANTRA
jgi:regulator of sigma E protease